MKSGPLRGIHEQLPVHLVAAYAHQIGTVVGQQAVGDKGMSWGRCLPSWTDDIGGRVVTGDAQFTKAGPKI